MQLRLFLILISLLSILPSHAQVVDAKKTAVYRRIRASLDSVPAIDTHDHLFPFELIPGKVKTDRGLGMTLHSIWSASYFTRNNRVTPWPASGKFEDWWANAKHDFDNARAESFYCYQLPAFKDLYGIDFDAITDQQASQVNDRIFEHYKDPRWVNEVITKRANIELMLNDPYWARLDFRTAWPFGVLVVNVTPFLDGYHPEAIPAPLDSPYEFAKKEGMKVSSLDDYLAVLERILTRGKEAGGVCLKTTTAYSRSLSFDNVAKERAAQVFGRKTAELTPEEIKAFQDYIMWRIVELSAKLDIPFQIHTGDARIQGSNPMLLVDMIAANPKTKFILFHGGYPWIGETGAIAMRYSNVWIDSCWMPTISYTMAKRAYQEWLEVVPSNRIMWGADANHAEGIYGATFMTRQCLAEALADKVVRGELREDHALRIGRQILRENALEIFPSLKARVARTLKQ